MTHHRGQDFGGEFQKCGIEFASNCRGELGDEGQSLQEIGVDFRIERGGFFFDVVAAFVRGKRVSAEFLR